MEIQQEKSDSQEPNVLKTKRENKTLLILLGFVLILVILSALFVLTRSGGIFEDKSPFSEIAEEPLKGEIYLTLSPSGEQKPNIYKLDVETMALEEYFPNSEYLNYMGTFTSELKYMIFVRAYEDENTAQLMLLDIENQVESGLTPRRPFFPRNPIISPDDEMLAYWIFESGESAVAENPEDNVIYLILTDGWIQEEVARGAFPFFSPDNNYLIYLKNDGLYTLDIEKGLEKKAINLNTNFLDEFLEEEGIDAKEFSGKDIEVWTNFRFHLSSTGEDLIITNTIASNVGIYKIDSWDEFTYEKVTDFTVNAPNWPFFSPSGRHFVIQDFDSEETPSLQLGFFDLKTLEYKETISFGDNYDLDYIWISDWIIK